jgi:hypothetical protein
MKRERKQLLALTVAAKEATVPNSKYREGIPQWMLERGYSDKEIDDLMALRRRAFPKTVVPQ